MGMNLVVLADTHVPARAGGLHPDLWREVQAADVVFHAGDWVDPALLDELEGRSRMLVGVYGNNDGDELRSRLPEIATVEFEGLRFSVVHETGGALGREKRCEERFPGTDVLIFGHSHIPWDTTTPNGMRLLNPGSPTDRRRQPHCTFMTAVAGNGTLRDVALVPVKRLAK